jgi:fatty-acyl-CoA synthase
MPNCPEWLHIFYAVAQIGAVLVPINTRLRTADLQYVLQQSDTATLILKDQSGPVDYLAMVGEVCPEILHCDPESLTCESFPELKRVVVLGDNQCCGTQSWNVVLSAAAQVPQKMLQERRSAVDPDDTVLLMYTSGTTGFPKGVMHNHNILRITTDSINRMGMTPNDVVLMYLPLFHAFGLYEGALMAVQAGSRMVLTETFEAGEALRLIEQGRVTMLHGFDTHFYDLTSHPDCEGTDRSSLRTGLFASGMASSVPVARRAQDLLCTTVTGWGMTEVGVGVSMSFLDTPVEDRCAGSGYPLPGYEFKVIDPETSESLPHGTMGELCTRGYAVMQGYYKKPLETAETVDKEGWLHTGDMATIREDGCLRFFGRYKDILKVGGENMDPIEVEAFLIDHPAVGKVQVVGVPDARLSEVPCACVVLQDGCKLSQGDLDQFCRGKLASFKIPRHLLLLDDYPMTSSGKVQKFRLREMALEALQIPTG